MGLHRAFCCSLGNKRAQKNIAHAIAIRRKWPPGRVRVRSRQPSPRSAEP